MTGTNGEAYFYQNFVEHREHNLPKTYFRKVYECMHELMRHRPTMNPLHHRDLLRPGDGIYNDDGTHQSSLMDMYEDQNDDHDELERTQESVPEDNVDSMGETNVENDCSGQRCNSH